MRTPNPDPEALARHVWARVVGANIAMLTLVVSLFVALAPPPLAPHRRSDVVRIEVIVVGLGIVVGASLMMMLARWMTPRETVWLREGRVPDAAERARLFSLPRRTGLLPLPLWVIGTVILVAFFRRVYPLSFDVRFAFAAAFGFLGAFAFSVLLVEYALGPVFGLALVGARTRRSPLGLLGRLLVAWVLGSVEPLIAVVFSPAKIGLTPLQWVVLLSGLAINLVLVLIIVRSFTEPLAEVRRVMHKIEDGDLDANVEVTDGGEVGELQAAVNDMIGGLRERRRLHDLFDRHVGSEVARHALANDVGLGGEARDASVMFVDLIASTALALTRSPDAVVATLNRVFGTLASVVEREGGWVNKFHGDGALCVFGVPDTQDDHAARALRAARAVRAALRALSVEDGAIDAGIGVSSGPVVAGNVGAESRYEYTVIGDAVNEAARLSDEAKLRPDRVLASAGVVARAGDEAQHWGPSGSAQLRGRGVATELFAPTASVTASSTG